MNTHPASTTNGTSCHRAHECNTVRCPPVVWRSTHCSHSRPACGRSVCPGHASPDTCPAGRRGCDTAAPSRGHFDYLYTITTTKGTTTATHIRNYNLSAQGKEEKLVFLLMAQTQFDPMRKMIIWFLNLNKTKNTPNCDKQL